MIKKLLITLSALMFVTTANAKKVTLMLDWFVNPDHGNVIIAHKMGYFKQMGLDVKILEPSDPSDPPKFVALKKVDYAMDYQHMVQIGASEGRPNVRVGTMISSPLAIILTLKSSGIKSLADLEGKTIGYSLPAFEKVIIGTMLKHNGASIDNVKLVNVNWALASSLMTKKVDAVSGAYRNFEVTKLDIEGYEGVAFYPEENGVPPYDEITLVTHRDNARSETTKKMLKALEMAVIYMKNNPKKSWEVFKSYKPGSLDDELNKRAWFDTIKRFSSSPSALDHRRYKEFAKFLEENKLVKNKIPALSTYAIDVFAE